MCWSALHNGMGLRALSLPTTKVWPTSRLAVMVEDYVRFNSVRVRVCVCVRKCVCVCVCACACVRVCAHLSHPPSRNGLLRRFAGTVMHSTMEGGMKSAETFVRIKDQAQHVVREVDPVVCWQACRVWRERERKVERERESALAVDTHSHIHSHSHSHSHNHTCTHTLTHALIHSLTFSLLLMPG